MILVVGVFVAAIWTAEMYRRAKRYREIASMYRDTARDVERIIALDPHSLYHSVSFEPAPLGPDRKGELSQNIDAAHTVIIPRDPELYRALAAKYERAARYPWLPVAPDPPEPK
jgi:hypothetical protein